VAAIRIWDGPWRVIRNVYSYQKVKWVVKARRCGKLYKLQSEIQVEIHASWAGIKTVHEWHCKLAHIGYKYVRQLLKNQVSITLMTIRPFCEDCVVGKMHRATFHTKPMEARAKEIGQTVHTDLCSSSTPIWAVRNISWSSRTNFQNSVASIFWKTKDEAAKYIIRIYCLVSTHRQTETSRRYLAWQRNRVYQCNR